MSEGEHTFSVQAEDGAKNKESSPKSYTWTIDTSILETTITKKPAKLTTETSATFEFVCNKAPCTFECKLDDEAWKPCSSGVSYISLSEGEHAFEVRATDVRKILEMLPKDWTWTVDSKLPETTITTKPSTPTNQTTGTFEFDCNETACTFECQIDNGAWSACSSAQEYPGLDEGTYTFRVRAKDAAGNIDDSPAEWMWTVDTTAPKSTIIDQPAVLTHRRVAEFEFECDETSCTFECQMDGGAWKSCLAISTFNSVFLGGHNLKVRAIDAAGNVEAPPKEWSWSVVGWSKVSTGSFHTCAVATDGTLWCWGKNNSAMLGINASASDVDMKTTPTQVGTDTNWNEVYAGGNFTCAQKNDHSLWCWGHQLGVLIGTDILVPTQIANDDKQWRQMDAGFNHICGIKSDLSLWCWGDNLGGKVGNGDTIRQPAPLNINVGNQVEKDWLSVSLGKDFTCATKQGGKLYCWGTGSDGQIGNGKNDPVNSDPIEVVVTGVDWLVASAGNRHVCAMEIGTIGGSELYCWGYNSDGQLGIGLGADKNTPQRVGDKNDWRRVWSGNNFTCGVRLGSRWCWGGNGNGQSGNGDDSNLTSLTSIEGFKLNTEMIATGLGWHVCKLRTDEASIYCWGRNTSGQVGNGKSGINQLEKSPVNISEE